MQITWPEINEHAVSFVYKWKDATYERGEAQTFWNEFFSVFGISRRKFATFEKHVALLGERRGFIDLFWKGTLIAEHKSAGKNLDSAYEQAIDYASGLSDDELPRYIIVSDFQRFRLYDLDEDKQWSFDLIELPRHIHLFGFMIGHTPHVYKEEDIVNIKAAELMGRLHDALKANGYAGHALELLLVRFMFCLFADDTGIFEKGHFTYYIEERTREDGADVGAQLTYIFQLLNTPESERPPNLDEMQRNFSISTGHYLTRHSRLRRSIEKRAIYCSNAAISIGLRFRPPYSAHFFKPSLNLKSGEISEFIIPRKKTYSRLLSRSF